jgi:hypothetical protein
MYNMLYIIFVTKIIYWSNIYIIYFVLKIYYKLLKLLQHIYMIYLLICIEHLFFFSLIYYIIFLKAS